MISQLVRKISEDSLTTTDAVSRPVSFEESLLQFEKLVHDSSDGAKNPQNIGNQIGMIGFDLLEAKQLESAFRSSYDQLTGHWQLSPSSKHRWAFVNCHSRMGREYLFGIVGSKREQLQNLILMVSDVSELKEFGIGGEDRCLVATSPLLASSVEFCLNSLADRRANKQAKPTPTSPANLTVVSRPTASMSKPLVDQTLSIAQRPASLQAGTFGLSTFPAVSILSLHRSHVRLSALMMHKPRSVEELAVETKTTELVVQNFFAKCREAKILVEHSVSFAQPTKTQSIKPVVPTNQSSVVQRNAGAQLSTHSLLGRLRSKFGF
jgi:hypothetical protein